MASQEYSTIQDARQGHSPSSLLNPYNPNPAVGYLEERHFHLAADPLHVRMANAAIEPFVTGLSLLRQDRREKAAQRRAEEDFVEIIDHALAHQFPSSNRPEDDIVIPDDMRGVRVRAAVNFSFSPEQMAESSDIQTLLSAITGQFPDQEVNLRGAIAEYNQAQPEQMNLFTKHSQVQRLVLALQHPDGSPLVDSQGRAVAGVGLDIHTGRAHTIVYTPGYVDGHPGEPVEGWTARATRAITRLSLTEIANGSGVDSDVFEIPSQDLPSLRDRYYAELHNVRISAAQRHGQRLAPSSNSGR